jgi:D-lactate dehydrogenase (cytochrome)
MTAGVAVAQDEAGGWRVLFTVEGLPEDVDAECEELTAALRQVGADCGDEARFTVTARWCAHLAAASDDDLLVRVGVPPQHLALYWRMLPEDVQRSGSWLIDAASGLLFVRWPQNDVAMLRNFLQGARQPALALRGYAAVLAGPEEIMTGPERWGWRADADDIAQAIRRRWDPSGILT